MDAPVFATNPCVLNLKIITLKHGRENIMAFNMDNDGVVTKVREGSRASLKGIQVDDVVTHINGTRLDAASAHSVACFIICRDTTYTISLSRLVSVDSQESFDLARQHVLRLCTPLDHVSAEERAVGN